MEHSPFIFYSINIYCTKILYASHYTRCRKYYYEPNQTPSHLSGPHFCIFVLLDLLCVTHIWTPQHTCGSQRATFKHQFSFSTCVSKIELKQSGLVAKHFYLPCHLRTPPSFFKVQKIGHLPWPQTWEVPHNM